MFYTKKRTDFLPARLIGWVLNFLEIGATADLEMSITGVHFQKYPKNAQCHLRYNPCVFCPLKCREAPTVGASRGWHLFYAPILEG